jgi:RNA 2',3'-cyclic 3'-phosphodiesterase
VARGHFLKIEPPSASNKTVTVQKSKLRNLLDPAGRSIDRARVFVGLPVVATLFGEFEALRDRLRAGPGGNSVRWTPSDKLHVTLRFLGNVDVQLLHEASARLERGCRGFAPFQLRFGELGCFPHERPPRVVWLALAGALDQLKALQAAVVRELGDLGDHQEDKPFAPHLTLGRVRKKTLGAAAVGRFIRELEVGPIGAWPISEVILMRSELKPEGSCYSPLAVVRLQG